MPNRRRLFIAFAAIAACLHAPAFAVGQLVDLQVIDRSRHETLPTYTHRGTHWVAGQPGSRYALRLTNRSGARVLVVLSVDGVNAVSGETAAVGQTGYVLAPWQTTEITGWRKSLTEAAAFYFTALPDSYAARTDRPDNVGVIGLAVFREREPARRAAVPFEGEVGANAARDRATADDGSLTRSMSPAPAGAPAREAAKSAAAPREERLGTGHGEREHAPTQHTAFERASERPAEIVRLRYDRREALLASGVIRPQRAPVQPEPFPVFVPDPKG